jgi:hypothetical protein
LSLFGEAIIKVDPSTIQLYKSPSLNQPGLLLDIEAVSSWVSIRANTAVFANVFYYECQLVTSGII